MREKAFLTRVVAFILASSFLFTLSGCKKKNETGLQDGPLESGTVLYQPDDAADAQDASAPSSAGPLGGFAVSSSSAEATWVGMQVLAAGGNAVDAAAAISLTLSVTELYSSGLGGSGIMLVYDTNTKQGYTLDYYCSAGSAAYPTDNVAVPGLLAGMQEALDRWGTITMAEAIQPAIDYAEKGFTANESFVSRLEYSDSLRNNPAYEDLEVGDLLVQAELAQTLKTIQSEGIEAFYGGSIGQKIVENCGLTLDDLKNYKVYCSDILRSSFYDYDIIGAYAPSSSFTVMQMLKMTEFLEQPSIQTDPNGYLNAMKTATMNAYDDRMENLVDPHFYDFDGHTLVSDEYIQSLVGNEVSSYVDDPEKMSTTQFAVIDDDGLVVCVTNSMSDTWGSYRCVGGFYLNNSLINFGTKGSNAYEPGKRPRTNFAPIIVEGPAGEVLAIGSPGGVYIPKIVSGVLIDILREKEDIQTAVDKARVMYNSDGQLCVETDDKAESIIDIASVNEPFYYNTSHIFFGCTSIVGYDPDEGFIAVCDRRRDGSQAMMYYYED